MKLILASRSPRRQELLARLGVPFEVVPPEHREAHTSEEDPDRICTRLAGEKAEQVAGDHPRDLVIGADTIVILGERIMGKPRNRDEAREMLHALADRIHIVKTAVVLVNREPGHRSGFVETTRVTFAPLSAGEIEPYVRSGHPLDKAGAYGIQDWSGIFVTGVEGCYHNVVGFPLARFYHHLKETRLWPRIQGTNLL